MTACMDRTIEDETFAELSLTPVKMRISGTRHDRISLYTAGPLLRGEGISEAD
jgi:hypothetical protein